MTIEELNVLNKLLVKFYKDETIKLNTVENVKELCDKYGYECPSESLYHPSDDFIYYQTYEGVASISAINFLECMCDDLVEQV